MPPFPHPQVGSKFARIKRIMLATHGISGAIPPAIQKTVYLTIKIVSAYPTKPAFEDHEST